MVYVARWPNATFEDGKIWRMMEGCRSADGGFDKHVGNGEWFGNTRFGVLYDDKFYKPETTDFVKETLDILWTHPYRLIISLLH